MKTLIQQLLTDESSRTGTIDARMAMVLSEKFQPWSSAEA